MNVDAIERALRRLERALDGGRSRRYCLRRWSSFVRTRDGHSCVVCGSRSGLAAHHIVRKVFVPQMQFETGNGATLCAVCHREPHAEFNRRPDLQVPMDTQGGESIEHITALFGALAGDGAQRGILNDRYYFLSDEALNMFRSMQQLPAEARISGPRIWQAYMIWRQTPRGVMDAVLRANGIGPVPGLVQQGPITVFVGDEEG